MRHLFSDTHNVAEGAGARKCNRTGGQSCDLTRRLQAFGIDVFRRDYDVSDADLLGVRRIRANFARLESGGFPTLYQ